MKDIQRSNTCRYFVRVFANVFILLQKRHCSIPLQYWWNVAKPRIPNPINRHLQIDWNAFKWHTSITREQEVFSSSNKEEMTFETVWSFWMLFLYCIAKQNKKFYYVCDFFCVFFWLFGENFIPLHRFCNMLIISTYFWFCYMFASSGANALIVS